MAVDLIKIDRDIWDSELSGFVPEKVFDFHCHIFNTRRLTPGIMPGDYGNSHDYSAASRKKCDEALFPGKTFNYLMTGWPDESCDPEKQNAFLLSECETEHLLRMLLLVRPGVRADYLLENLGKTGAAGFKPYKCFSVSEPENSGITDYLPHEQLEIANGRGLIITLHLSRKKGIADEKNFNELMELSGRYSEITWNLAHCGRSFTPEFLESSTLEFKELKRRKVYFDISAVTDSEVMYFFISAMGASRILFGSDYPVGLQRGKCVGFGYDWMFITDNKINFKGLRESFGVVEPTFIVYEQLRALKRACNRAALSREEVADIFYKNAEKLILSRTEKGV